MWEVGRTCQQDALRDEEVDNDEELICSDIEVINNTFGSDSYDFYDDDTNTENNNETFYTPDDSKRMCFLLANARSLAMKFDSLIDMFRNLNLDFAMINETWLKNDRETDSAIKDVKDNEEIDIVKKNRKSARGGGVAIVFDMKKIKLKNYPIPNNKYELVCAVGRQLESSRKIAVFSAYIPPRQKAETTRSMMECIADCIEKIKCELHDPLIVIGGDFNGREVTAVEDFGDIKKSETGPTRGNSVLDVIFDNANAEYSTFCPLETEEGVASDHLSVLGSVELPKLHQYTVEYVETYKYSKEGEELFGERLLQTNWQEIAGECSSATAANLEKKLTEIHNECFPIKRTAIRSCDPPWYTKKLKRMIRNRKRLFKRQGRSARWKKKKKEIEAEELRLKTEYFQNVKKKIKEAGNNKAYYVAANSLQTGGFNSRWRVQSMFPGKANQEIAEKAADFFNRISQLFEPLPAVEPGTISQIEKKKPPELYEISAALKSCRKPKSRVKGDIDRRLVSKYSDLLAIPLQIVYDQVYSTLVWPELWSTETVHLIPKCTAPDDLSQLRNLSCTPLFSKVLESFTLRSLKSKVKLSGSQFGGLKGAGVDHFLVETFDEVLTALEDSRASVNLMSIDFEKAFNRMCHTACLEALSSLNADPGDIALVKAFLSGRSMSVKVDDCFSSRRSVPGGSPQGSILGNFLFCATTDMFNRISATPIPGPSHPVPASTLEDSLTSGSSSDSFHTANGSDYNSDENEFRFVRSNPVNVIYGHEQSVRFTQDEIDEVLGVPEGWENKKCCTKAYIDDLNIIEKVRHSDAISITSANKRVTKAHAPQSEAFFPQYYMCS